jgi:hypothetical protein
MGQQSANSAGGVFMFFLKSGTNQFHGSVYGSMQNEALNANTWGNKSRTPLDRMQDYAVGGGGPIIKDKTFFFAAFEQYRFTDFVDVGTPSTVPTSAFLNGDFSALLTNTPVGANDACGNTIYKGAIIDPTTGCYFTFNSKLNVINPARFSSVSKQIIGIYQQYYQPANAALTDNAVFPNYNTPWFHQTQFSIKADHNICRTQGTEECSCLSLTGFGVFAEERRGEGCGKLRPGLPARSQRAQCVLLPRFGLLSPESLRRLSRHSASCFKIRRK